MLEVHLIQTEEEKEALYRFRYQVYVLETHYTQEANHEKQQLYDALDDVAHSLALFSDGEIVGSLRLLFMDEVPDLEPFRKKFAMSEALEQFGPSAICTTGRFMIDPSLRNGKAMFKLIRSAFLLIIEHGARLNFGDCSPHLIPFYEHMGYRRYTLGFNDSEYGYKIPILMLLRDHSYLKSVRSLMYRIVKHYPDDIDAGTWFSKTYPGFLSTCSGNHMDETSFLELLTERVAQDPHHPACLLVGLSPEEIQTFLSQVTLFPVKPGDQVIRKGDTDQSLYVLLKGLAHVVQQENARPLAVLGAGDTFGEIGFLTATTRTAHVIAQTEGEVLVLTRAFLERFIKQNPVTAAKVCLNLSKELAARLAFTSKELETQNF